MASVLIVDDEESICWCLERVVEALGYTALVASSAEDALSIVKEQKVGLVILDVRLPGMDGLTAMQHITRLSGPVPIIIITAFGDLETAVTAVRNGAFDYLTKPFELDRVTTVISRALADRSAECIHAASITRVGPPDELHGAGPAMQTVFKRIALVAASDCPVLITGESGTGKELVARAIHRHSARSNRPLVPTNLAALSPTLVESELFGHVRGAFTGADTERQGLLELADGGTVFFDEVADIPPNVQVKLLRVLEQQEVTPVGSTQARKSDFRIIAASHRNLRRGFEEGLFRQDLYFRLAAFEIALPPLRNRGEDIVLLANLFLERIRGSSARQLHFTSATLDELRRRSWPGNVRELRNAIEHCALMARTGVIEPEDLPPPMVLEPDTPVDSTTNLAQAVRQWASTQLVGKPTVANLYDEFLGAVERPLFESVLDKTDHNRAAAADVLGMHRATLRKKLK